MRTRENLAIYTDLFKRIGFYQTVDPNGSKIFGYNAHRFVHGLMVAFTFLYTFVGLSGVFCGPDDAVAVDVYRDAQTLFYVACISVGNLKIVATIRHADAIWKWFFVARENRDVRLADCARRFARIFPWYLFLFANTAFAWVLGPIVSNRGDAPPNGSGHVRKTNVINLRYPVAAKTYDRFYAVFYAMESVMASYSAFGLVSFDLFMIAMLRMTSVQYEIVASSYESLKRTLGNGNDDKSDTRKLQKEFVAITAECQCINERLKVTYRISRPIVFVYMIGDAIGMVSMPYLVVRCFTQNGSSINTSDVLKFLFTLCVVGIQCYMYCSLYQRVNDRKEAINFGIYSCDWTLLSIQNKKLILFAMQMNNSNQLKMSVTPTKRIDLPMFASIVRSSYSTTSVLINSSSNK